MEHSIRIVDTSLTRPALAGSRRRCEAPGCRFATSEEKPFCLRHLSSHPYVQALLARLEAGERPRRGRRRRPRKRRAAG
jgi:hypothetical protein